MTTFLPAAIAYFVMWMLTWMALLAYVQREFPLVAQENYRRDLVLSVVFSLVPATWILAPFVTSFYEHGFQIRPLKECYKP